MRCAPPTWTTAARRSARRSSTTPRSARGCARRSASILAGSGTTPRAGTRRCWPRACGSSAASTCGLARRILRHSAAAAGTPSWRPRPGTAGTRRPSAATASHALFDLEPPAPTTTRSPSGCGSAPPSTAAPSPGKLALLLAAESVGALIAAEMRHRRPAVDARSARCAPRPSCSARGRSSGRPARMEALLAEVRAALDEPELNPDSPVELLQAVCSAPGCRSTSTRSWELKQIEHPAIAPAAGVQEARPAAQRQRLALARRVGRRRPLPARLRARRRRHRPLGVGRRGSAAAAQAGARRGHRRPGLDLRGRRRRAARAAGARRDVAATRRWPGPVRRRTCTRAWSTPGAVETRPQAKYGMLGAIYGGTTGESGRHAAAHRARLPACDGVRRRRRARGRARRGGHHLARPQLAARCVAPALRRDARRMPKPGAARNDAARLGPVHPQLRGAGHGGRVGAVLDGLAAPPAVAARRRTASAMRR